MYQSYDIKLYTIVHMQSNYDIIVCIYKVDEAFKIQCVNIINLYKYV